MQFLGKSSGNGAGCSIPFEFVGIIQTSRFLLKPDSTYLLPEYFGDMFLLYFVPPKILPEQPYVTAFSLIASMSK